MLVLFGISASVENSEMFCLILYCMIIIDGKSNQIMVDFMFIRMN